MLNQFIDTKENLRKSEPFYPGTKWTNSITKAKPGYMLESYFTKRSDNPLESIKIFQRRTKRLVLKKGTENVLVLIEHIVFFYSENKITYAIDHSGTKYIVEINLISLEKELDNILFFRANRQFIININYIRSFRSYERVKLKVFMTPEELNIKYNILIGQERSVIFKKWICAE